MNETTLDLNSLRAKKARLARRIGKVGYRSLVIIGLAATLAPVLLLVVDREGLAYLSLALALISFIFALWYKRDLSVLTTRSTKLTDKMAGSVLERLDHKQQLSAKTVWDNLSGHWQVIFLTNHLLLPPDLIANLLASQPIDINSVWLEADRLSASTNSEAIEPGHIAAALILISPSINNLLNQAKLQKTDVESANTWLGRIIDSLNAKKPYFGGIGRDWANGFTKQLSRYGRNISLGIEKSGGNFSWLTTSPGVTAMKNSFSQGAKALALVGEDGVGKTSHVYALAQLLLEERNDHNLEHRQVIELNPSVIISSASYPGEIEYIVIGLLNETAHAGHIILFLDDANLFFTQGTGSFDITQILLPAIQSGVIQLVMALTPKDYQQLRITHTAFANLLTPVVLSEPDEAATINIVQDAVIGLEARHHVIITYRAIKEAYSLSGRYEQNMAYPGKAIQLLEQSVSHSNGGLVNELSVQQTIEQTKGVKVSTTTAVEADTLLNLEAKIHERMINQTQAVSVVASALRRARAGVSNPKRPIGSFLFLGPTGVGKTELAKSLAAIYFSDEQNMIRLDMSEYQQPEAVNRLLSDGQQESSSLILSVRQKPFSVILLDEVEKAHPNVLNLLLQLLDEGQLTDSGGRSASFKDCIIIATSNAGAQSIRERVQRGEAPEKFQSQLLEELMQSGQFKPELINRFDEIVVFRPLNQDELAQVVQLMVNEVNQTLSSKNIAVQLTSQAVQKIVSIGYDPRLGARPMRRALQQTVENTIAQKILRGEAKAGDRLVLDVNDLVLK